MRKIGKKPAGSIADWQLPAGVDKGLWSYAHDDRLAQSYDESLRDCALVQIDQDFALRHCAVPGALIDLGCGTGRTLIPFAQRGHRAVGVDLSEEMLRVAGKKAEAAEVNIELLQANLVELDAIRDSQFDYAVCLFSTLGMIAKVENRRRFLAHVHRILKPGGGFVLHVHNRWFKMWHRQGRRWLINDVLRSALGASDVGDRHMPAHDGQAALTLHVFTRREISRLLRETRFRLIEIHPVGLRPDGELSCPWWFGQFRAYGYLIAAQKD